MAAPIRCCIRPLLTLAGLLLLLDGISNSVAAAVLEPLDIVKFEWAGTSGHASGGGEFAVHKLLGQNSAGQDVWEQVATRTFCLEYTEHISLGSKYRLGAVSDRAVLGGAGGQQLNSSGQSLGDPIDPRTEFLYSAYATQALGSVGFVENDHAWANSLQEAIWRLEGEVAGFSTPHGAMLFNYAQSHAPSLRVGNVFALNVFDINTPLSLLANFKPLDTSTWAGLSGYHRQDQLYYTPTVLPPLGDPSSVPEPATALVWGGLGLCGCVVARRRKRSRGAGHPSAMALPR